MPVSEETRKRMLERYGAAQGADQVKQAPAAEYMTSQQPHQTRARSGSGWKGFLMGAAAVGAGIALWFGGQKQGEAKVQREGPQPAGLQLVMQQHQQKGTGGSVYVHTPAVAQTPAQSSLRQEVQDSYESSVRTQIRKGNIGNAVAAAQAHGALKTVVTEHAMGLPEKAAMVESARMDTTLAWEGASQADARARTAHSDNETMWENTVGRVHNVEGTVREVRHTVNEIRGLKDAFKAFKR